MSRTLKISGDSRQVIDEVLSNTVYSRVNVKDVIAVAWPKCPNCDAPLVQKFASRNLICVRCKTEYRLEHV
jgi:ribosomal protein L37AE/L43A